jgi:molybdate transport system regulatory protein
MTRGRGKDSRRVGLDGALVLSVGGRALGGRARIELLRAIDQHGSITAAAKAVGLSYKAAWDAIDTMNNLVGEPLVLRSTGGRGGGSSRLSALGHSLVDRFDRLDALHRRFLRTLDETPSNERDPARVEAEMQLLGRLGMRTSARNQFAGVVSKLVRGAVNDEVETRLPGGATITAIVTRESTETLGLAEGVAVIALVGASAVMVATGMDPHARVSARNRVAGTVAAIERGAVNAEIVLDIDGGGRIAATVTLAGLDELGLAVGARATALFKASAVILAVAP